MEMRRRFGATAAAGILTTVLLGLAGWAARPQTPEVNLPPMNGAVKTTNDAYLLLAPEFVAGPKIQSVSPSRNHDFLLIVREAHPVTPPLAPVKPQSEVSLILWDMRTRKSTVLWRGASNTEQMVAIHRAAWVPRTPDMALVQIVTVPPNSNDFAEGQSRILRVDARAGTAKTLAVGAANEHLLVSETQPVAALTNAALIPNKAGMVRLLRLDSGLGRSFPTPENARIGMWLPDGRRLFGHRTVRQPDGKAREIVFLLHTDTGVVTELQDRKELRALLTAPEAEDLEPQLPPLRIVPGNGKVNAPGGATTDLRPLWLSGVEKDAEGAALLTPDGENPRMLRQAALFYRQGALYAAPVEKMDRTAYEKLRREVLRRQVMNNAKQIGLAMMMYAQDYDENFPPNGDAVRDQILPYLKNDNVFLDPETGRLGFSLASYANTGLASFESPATTPLGYLTGPGGRAIIYVDGHVRWEDTP
jgi:hypothetical protein